MHRPDGSEVGPRGHKKRSPLRGSVFGVSGWLRLGQLGERGFDGIEVWQILRRRGLLGVLDDAVAVDDEGSTGGGVTDASEAWEEHIVGFGGFFVEVADERDGDLFFLCPGFLCEGAVHTDADHVGVQGAVGSESGADFAEFLGADASESERDKQQHGVFTSSGDGDIGEAVGVFGLEGEGGGFGADGEWHSGVARGFRWVAMKASTGGGSSGGSLDEWCTWLGIVRR